MKCYSRQFRELQTLSMYQVLSTLTLLMLRLLWWTRVLHISVLVQLQVMTRLLRLLSRLSQAHFLRQLLRVHHMLLLTFQVISVLSKLTKLQVMFRNLLEIMLILFSVPCMMRALQIRLQSLLLQQVLRMVMLIRLWQDLQVWHRQQDLLLM